MSVNNLTMKPTNYRNGPGSEDTKPERHTEYITIFRIDILFIFER